MGNLFKNICLILNNLNINQVKFYFLQCFINEVKIFLLDKFF